MERRDIVNGRAEIETFSLQRWRRKQGNWESPLGGKEVEMFIRKANRRDVHNLV